MKTKKTKKRTMAETLAFLLKDWRERTKKSQQEAAAAIGVSWHTFQRWESSLFTPNAKSTLMICKATGIPLEHIFNA